MGVTLPASARVLYAEHDGQHLAHGFGYQRDGDAEVALRSVVHGIIGGYKFYSVYSNVGILPLGLSRVITTALRQNPALMHVFVEHPGAVVIAASWTLGKVFLLDTADGA